MSADRPSGPPVVTLSDWVVDPTDGDDGTAPGETACDDPDADPGGADEPGPTGRGDRPAGDRPAGDDEARSVRGRSGSRARMARPEDRDDSRQQVYDRLDAWRGQSHR